MVDRKKRRRWLGGYVSHGKRGQMFVIERVLGGVKVHVSTRCRTERAALKELERFETAPFRYRPHAGADVLELTDELVVEYRDWMLKVKKTGREWALSVANLLADWTEDLAGEDIRAVELHELEAHLDKRITSRKHRIEAIKGFCTWLRRRKGLLKRGEDPTLDLPVPQDRPSKLKRKKVVKPEHVEALLSFLPPVGRDVLTLQAGTALHLSEVRRFATTGEVVESAIGEFIGVIAMKHKRGTLHSVGLLFPELLDAAERLRQVKRFPSNTWFADNMRAAVAKARAKQEAAGVAEELRVPSWFRNGMMRHSVLTWAHDRGAARDRLRDFAGHRTERTTEDFYVDSAVPAAAVPLPRLKLV